MLCCLGFISNRRKTDVKKLLTGIVAFTIAVGCAVAQAGEAYDADVAPLN